MIKELLLSLAVAAASGVSFVGSPKKAALPSKYSNFSGVYSVSATFSQDDTADYSGPVWYGEIKTPMSNNYVSFGYNQFGTDLEIDYGGDWNSNLANAYRVVAYSDSSSHLNITFYWGSFNSTELSEWDENFFNWRSNFSTTGGAMEDEALGEGDYYYQTIAFNSSGTARFLLGDEPVIEYHLTKNYINCDISSSPVLPSTYTNETAPMKPSYYVLMVSNAGGYGFTSESVTQTGGIVIRNFNLFDQYNNSGCYASLSFTAELPFNDCSITIQAFLPSYTITTNLERCTVSPAIPSSYTGTSFYGDYTFTAVNGYGFNENYTHWEVSNLFVDSVEFSSLLWGSFYSSVTLRLRASGGNSSISVTAIEYDEENYKLGYDEGRADGWKAGYDRGHADGEIAGNSYGVWNWLKQAAITTGEFLSIPLLPGFSIGGLLTALAGLVIIWFFIKGFLFKS